MKNVLRTSLFLISIIFSQSYSFARHESLGPDDPLLDYILTDQFDKALAEINKRIEGIPQETNEKDALLYQKISILIKKHDAIQAQSALALLSAETKKSSEYSYKSWLVHWELLKITPKNHKRFDEYKQKGLLGLTQTLSNPSFYSASSLELAESFLKEYPDKVTFDKFFKNPKGLKSAGASE